MRERLIELLSLFQDDVVDALELRTRIYEMFKEDIEKELDPREATMLNKFFSDYLDVFDPRYQPTTGTAGWITDRISLIFQGRYRVSESVLKQKAAELLDCLQGSRPRVG